LIEKWLKKPVIKMIVKRKEKPKEIGKLQNRRSSQEWFAWLVSYLKIALIESVNVNG
jgi:hypothetical protein